METLHLDTVKPLVHSVLRERYERVCELLEIFYHFQLRPYEPVLVRIEGAHRILCPPVVEIGERATVVDGSHRLLAAVAHGVDVAEVITIRSEQLPRPASRCFDWGDLRVEEEVDHWQDRTSDFSEDLFRPVVGVSAWLERQPINRQNNFDMEVEALCKSFGPPTMTFRQDKTSS
ncbi:hypothetical protein [Oceaniradius stylonematis]|uniref:hypothetical protein n=1 Tax=Oceaniradius stylonematis TaxID=2184161 RepID=UPI003F704286